MVGSRAMVELVGASEALGSIPHGPAYAADRLAQKAVVPDRVRTAQPSVGCWQDIRKAAFYNEYFVLWERPVRPIIRKTTRRVVRGPGACSVLAAHDFGTKSIAFSELSRMITLGGKPTVSSGVAFNAAFSSLNTPATTSTASCSESARR
jgi:hypothetical protein